MRRTERGFTLMELMVVIVIVAILAAVAVPLYINYVKDAQRTEAKGAIGALITGEQAYFQKHLAYTNDLATLNVDLTDLGTKWGTPVLELVGGTSPGFSALIEGAGSNAGMSVKVTYVRGMDPVWVEN